jgi:hypothetical protein
MKKTILFLALTILCACTQSAKSPTVTITKTANNAIKFSGLDLTTIQNLNTDSASASAWQSLIPVYKMPKDTDAKDLQPVQPGKYVVLDSLVIFTPDTPLQQGQAYFARCYLYGKGSSVWQQVKNHQKLTDRKYIDLILKQ